MGIDNNSCSNMENNIRRAKSKDIPQIIDLLIQVNMVHHEGRPDIFKGPATKYSEAELEELFKDESRPVFVFTEGEDKILGYAFCIFKQYRDDNILTDIKTLYIDDLCVDERARGKRVGKRLYDYVLKFAKEKSCYNLTLNVWACNKSAISFYEKCGLKQQKIGMEQIIE